jgi:hypothetical protein
MLDLSYGAPISDLGCGLDFEGCSQQWPLVSRQLLCDGGDATNIVASLSKCEGRVAWPRDVV